MDDWSFTGYQGLFCPANKSSCDRLPGGLQLVKNGGQRMFLVQSEHFFLNNSV